MPSGGKPARAANWAAGLHRCVRIVAAFAVISFTMTGIALGTSDLFPSTPFVDAAAVDPAAMLVRRQTSAPIFDPNQCTSGIYCNPKGGETFNASDFAVHWNPTQTLFAANTRVSVFLVSSYQSDNIVYKQEYIPSASGNIRVQITPKFFSTGTPGKPVSEKFRLWILPGGDTPLTMTNYANIEITLAAVLPSASSATPTSTSSSGDASALPPAGDAKSAESGGLGVPATVGIGVGAAVVLAALVAGILLMRARKRRQLTAAKAEAAAAAATDAPPSPGSLDAPGSALSGGRASGNANLSAGDAILIAATYRQLMRKPSWKAGDMPDDDDDDDDDEDSSLDPVLKRQEMGARVLMESLADEGHGLRNVASGTAIRVEDSASAITEPSPSSARPSVTSTEPLTSSNSPKSITR
ncbi:hypothetical protein THASP1DRAFT_22497 [Thamnocephalis sphaerospora]|uniref:Uncharacterized protein n=1 Tax=Thamnocephalis sphaerospora TaxID=78915 RepID=A0A4P9XU27_9FUNG|nr:hypothetical protein THASP1DRAFT_22497 [Thamnocephalis sphaerospora]|eukprot:RKP09686.1 hypothetical protein THASP1DRAFT_22497 [Thamnocephalis sphaerospora]